MSRSCGSVAVLILICSAFVMSCAASNRLTLDWADSDYQGRVNNVLVVGVTKEEARRRVWETTLVDELRSRGIEASTSFQHLPVEILQDEAQARAKIGPLGVDAVLFTRLLRVDKETEYVPPRTTTHYSPYPYYSGMYPYYYNSYQQVTEPGYYEENTIVTLESNLYAVQNEELVWSAQSESFNPSSVEKVIEQNAKLVVKSLSDRGLLATPEK